MRLVLVAILALPLPAQTFLTFWEGTSFGVAANFAPLVEQTLKGSPYNYTVFDNTSGGKQICDNLVCAYVTAIAGSSVGTYSNGCENAAGTTVCRAPVIDDPYFGQHAGSYLVFWQDGPTNDVSATAGFETTLETRITDLFARRVTPCSTASAHCSYVTSTIIARGWPSPYNTYDTVRLNYNTWARGNTGCNGALLYSNANSGAVYRCANGAPFHYLVDAAADTRLGVAGDETNTTYFNVDQVHMNATGYVIFDDLVIHAISGIPMQPTVLSGGLGGLGVVH